MRRQAAYTGLVSSLVALLVFGAGAAHGQTQSPAAAAASSKRPLHAVIVDRAPGALQTFSGGMGAFATPLGRPFGDEGNGVVHAPYSGVGTFESVTEFADGNRIVQKSTTRLYRDSQGRTRTEHVVPAYRLRANSGSQATEHVAVWITDPVARERYQLNAHDRSVSVSTLFAAPVREPPIFAPPLQTQFAMPGAWFAAAHSPVRASKPIALGEQIIESINVVGSRVEEEIEAGVIGNERPITSISEQWFSPELGLVILKTQRTSTGNQQTYRLEQIERTEPDAGLFVLPADYKRRDIGAEVSTMESVRGVARPITAP